MCGYKTDNRHMILLCLRGNYIEFPLKQKHFVQSMRTRTRRNECGEYKLFFVDYHTVIGENIVEPRILFVKNTKK